jgi:uncharacterized protein (DUF1800 family)
MDIGMAHALARFGLGRKGSEPLPGNPTDWLAGQLRAPDPGPPGERPTTAAGLAALEFDRREKPPPELKQVEPLWKAQAAALTGYALATPTPFRERLVWFWTNHFTVSLREGSVRSVAGAFVAEAIRPHVTGRFSEMLLAVMRHPAMLMYLNNAQSVGPRSPAGLKNSKGLNENLARECMELHTVSPAARYTQADVTAFAAVITGWSVEMKQPPLGFRFRLNAHEPGEKTVMGHAFPEGEQGGVLALAFLANHPSTHRFLATKLARHFVADDPPPDAVRRIEGVLRDTEGDLGAASLALVSLDAAWRNPGAKLRTPQDYVVAALRAADLPADKMPQDGMWIANTVGGLGQPYFSAPLPNGWGDRAIDWTGPEAMLRRIDWSYGLAGRMGQADPEQLAEASLGPLLRAGTREQMAGAGSRRDAITLVLSSPEFQRR